MITELTTGRGTRAKIGLPAGYDQTKRYPLIQFHHGIGERGTNLELVDNHGPLKQVYIDNVDIGFEAIIVHPQVQSGVGGKDFGKDVLDYVIANYAVDTNRIYLMWLSMGGFTGWPMVQDPAIVSRIAAFVSICAADNDPGKASVLANEGIVGWAAHAFNDLTVPYSNTKDMVVAVNQLANDELIRLNDIGYFGHGIWNKFLDVEVGVYDWLKYQRLDKRKPATEIVLRAGQSIVVKA